MEAGGRRRKGQRILYFFRTPPSVRIGREALDPEAMRLLEAHNPDVSFDWARLKSGSTGSGSPGSSGSGSTSGSRREERRRDRRDARSSRPDHGRAAASTQISRQEPPAEYAEYTEYSEDTDRVQPTTSAAAVPGEGRRGFEAAASEPVEPEPVEPNERVEPEPVEPEPVEPNEPVDPPVPERFARLGSDGLRRLRARYADVKARLEGKPLEEAERDELVARVERLNPDAWHTEDEVARALEEYEAVFESLRPIVGRRPARPRL